MMNLIPPQYRVAAALGLRLAAVAAVVLAVWAAYSWAWNRGADHVQGQWDAAVLKQQAAAAKTGEKRAAETVKVVTEYVDRVRVVRERGETIVKEVPVYVPADSCPLPAGWGVLHDAAATGGLPDPAVAADGPPVDPRDAAETVGRNYATCHANAERLTALQEWVRRQAAIQ